MRIYIPLTLSDLSAPRVSARRVHAVTAELRAMITDEDNEGYEYIATLAAADDSLRLLDKNSTLPLRRVVGVAEVADNIVRPVRQPQLPTEQDVIADLEWNEIESFHIDAPGSESLVARALNGDEEAFLATGDIELLWYDISERQHLSFD
ncbi:DUF6912 family protein [Arcanobacterium pinnipediorum]|uniref:Uncharacterized protein n=1 Tax=Arcanobacterium pinnipediorum TaxID=1503041 RepID=A0ABY5AHK7_9ACTO|nr:hypothetical protein [Arcanobacterium pinnipediorum]USR79668.1 hypothetical protein NG665_01360 [Arcanobacterium pinnipediorum]